MSEELTPENRALIERDGGVIALRALDRGEGSFFGPATLNRLLDAARAEGLSLLTGKPTHRHVKRGTLYKLEGMATLQVEAGPTLMDYDRLAVYRDEQGNLWARPEGEFADGRFEPLSKVEEP